MYQKETVRGILFLALAIWTAFLVFSCPQVCEEAFSSGVRLCTGTLLLSLLPFLIVSSLLIYCDVGKSFAVVFRPFARCMGIEGEMTEKILFIGILGGFAPAVQAVKTAVERGRLSPQKASLVLSAAVLPSPSFVILTVGYSLLNSKILGVKLFLSQSIANYLATAILFWTKKDRKNHTTTKSSDNKISVSKDTADSLAYLPPLSQIISDCTIVYIRLCGVILYFRLLCRGIQAFLPSRIYCVLAMLLEVSAGCEAASQVGMVAAFWCSAALSVEGISAISQVRMLCPKEVSLKPMLLSKLFQIPISLVLLKILLVLETDREVYSSLEEVRWIGQKIPADCALLVFVGCCIVAYKATQAFHLVWE